MVSTASIETQLRPLVEEALRDWAGSAHPGDGLPAVTLEAPRSRSHGDLSTSIAMQLASRQKKPPLELAKALTEKIQTRLQASPLARHLEDVQVKPPGFINFIFSRSFLCDVLEAVLENKSSYGRVELGRGQKAHIEFVSANPTGPLSVAHGRQAAVGDAVANLLEFSGYQVVREYYVNDEGTQIDLLGASILARAREETGAPADFPENGYKGTYVTGCARAWLQAQGRGILNHPQAQRMATRFGAQRLLGVIETDLKQFGVRFNRWYRQSKLKSFGYLTRSLNRLKGCGSLYASEGAWWLKSTDFGDDKDRVVIRSDGRLTYIASDIAYHRRKFSQGFSLVVNLWGPDHHGYIPRLKAAVEALGFDPKQLAVRIVQLCTLKRGKETIPMSTREGEFTTLAQVMQEVGVDATRFFFLLRKSDAHLEFDLELAKQQSLENPVYYIQYAHARVASILNKIQAEGTEIPPPKREAFRLLEAPEELYLLKLLREFPGVVSACAATLEPFGMVSYLQTLAEGLHRFYDRHRVMGTGSEQASARLGLILGVQAVLANGLKLLGVSTPTKM